MTKYCELCATAFEVTLAKAQQAKRFCSKACSNKATAQKRADALRDGPNGYKPNVCPCGEYVEPPSSGTYNYTKKYCSTDCRRKYMVNGNQRDDSKWATYTCLNCEETFERRLNIRNAKKYCSNACAMRHTKIKKHYGIEGMEIIFDSSYEAFFWGACAIAKLPVQRFNRQYAVEWKPGQFYGPDFYMPSLGLAVELKGHKDEDDDLRWSSYGSGLVVLDRDDLLHMSPLDVLGFFSQLYSPTSISTS